MAALCGPTDGLARCTSQEKTDREGSSHNRQTFALVSTQENTREIQDEKMEAERGTLRI
jgi:hypothetical protein